MSNTRKILLALTVLVGLLGLFKTYDTATTHFYEDQARDRERNKTELRALEAGKPPPNGLELDPSARQQRIDDLRAWTAHADEDTAHDQAEQRSRWIGAIVTLLIAAGLGGAFVLSGRQNGPRAFVRLGQLRASIVVAMLTALVALPVCLTFAKMTIERQEELAHAESRLVEAQHRLESIKFDANGNVDPSQRETFDRAMIDAKYVPETVASSRANRNITALIAAVSALMLAAAVYFGWRGLRQPASAPHT